MKNILLIALLLGSVSLFAQNQKPKESGKFDIRFGVGVSILGTGDYVTLNIENELNYKINRYFTAATSLQFGRNSKNDSFGYFSTTSFVQGNLNLFISPFTNVNNNDVRIGSGFSVYNISEA